MSAASEQELIRDLRERPEEKRDRKRLRAFAINLGKLDSHPVSNRFVDVFERVARKELSESTLTRMRKEVLDQLDYFYNEDYEKDPSYTGIVEADLRPLERLCDLEISWDELCDVTDRMLDSLMRRSALSPDIARYSESEVVEMLRLWLEV